MRFVPITKDVSIQYWLEFMGEAADRVRWIEEEFRPHVADIYYAPERIVGGKSLNATVRLYLEAVVTDVIDFQRAGIDELLNDIGVKEDFCKLQLRRENDARIVCFRPTDERPAFTGFGRTKLGMTRPCHQDFSETYVDRKPCTEFTNYKGEKQIWDGFKPLYLKVQPADASAEPYYLRIKTEWDETGHIIVFVNYVHYNEAEIPPELVAYQFSPRGVGVIGPQAPDPFEASAAIRRFVKT